MGKGGNTRVNLIWEAMLPQEKSRPVNRYTLIFPFVVRVAGVVRIVSVEGVVSC